MRWRRAKEEAKGYDFGTWDRTVQQKCERLGLPGPGMADTGRGKEWVLMQAQLRVWEGEREERNARVWWFALASAAASVVSAVVALVAILR